MKQAIVIVALMIAMTPVALGQTKSGNMMQKKPEPEKPIQMKVTMAMGIDTGVLTIDKSGISYKFSDTGYGKGYLRVRTYSELEYCTFLDNRHPPGVIIGGKEIKERGFGSSMWILVQEKKESSRRDYVVHPEYEAEFLKAARVFGNYCKGKTKSDSN